MATRAPVRPSVPLLTELRTRELLAKSLLALCSEHGPTCVGVNAGCDEKTVRNARDEKSTLGLDTAFNLLALDPAALNPLLAHFGLIAAPIHGSEGDLDDLAREAAGFVTDKLEADADGIRTTAELQKLKARARRIALKAQAVAA